MSTRLTVMNIISVLSGKDLIEVGQIVIWKEYAQNKPDVNQFQVLIIYYRSRSQPHGRSKRGPVHGTWAWM